MPHKIAMFSISSRQAQAKLRKAKNDFKKAWAALENIQKIILETQITINNVTAALQQALIAIQSANNSSKQLQNTQKPDNSLKYEIQRTQATAKAAEDCVLKLIDNYIRQELIAIDSKHNSTVREAIIKGIQKFVREQLQAAKLDLSKPAADRKNFDPRRIINGAIELGTKYLSKETKQVEKSLSDKRSFDSTT